MVTLAIDALLVIFALGCLMARFPTVHTQSSALASSRAMAVRLAVEATQRCSERTAFLASGNEIPRSTFICCTFFSNFHLGHSREEAEWSPL